ncbi:DMT family transporter [Ornithinimicrobium pekingense]|uniref:Multidrug transporter n=1 Tax=Ornithinimicrobium pekingense TaxID=384677 RepID=A0ABQ2F493_9MICO|nr:DMT family transporter [Ornithinimicrobium pekingense]GGK59478.1 multidrug transporter [Ornithinimicrobium pekingense]
MSRRTGALPWQVWYVALAFIWGSSYLLIKLGLGSLTAVQVASLRIVCGVAVLLVLLAATRTRLPRGRRTWGHLLVTGTLLCTLPWTLFAVGEERVTSAVAGISNATTPVVAVLATALLLPGEPVGRRRQRGVAIGFAGVVLIAQPWSAERGPDPAGLAMVLAASASYGVGWTYVRRFLHGVDPGGLSMPAAQVLVAAAQVPLLVLGDWWLRGAPAGGPLAPGGPDGTASGWGLWGPVLAVVVLGVVGTGLAQAMQYAVVRAAGPTVATSVTYPIIVVSVLLGVLVLGESVGPVVLLGAGVVLVGSLLITGPRRPGRARGEGAPHTPGVSVDPARMGR